MKMNFDNEFPKKLEWVLKSTWKNGVICLVFMSPFWVMVFKLLKIVSFSQYFADINKTFKAVIVIFQIYTHLKIVVSLF